MAKKLRPLTARQYAKKGGNMCPSCNGIIVDCDSIEVDGNTAWQNAECDKCGASWTDVYKLVGYENLTMRGE